MPVPDLITERLVLRAFTRVDARRVQHLAGDFRIADTTGHMPHPYLEGMAQDWIAEQESDYQEGTGATFALTLRETGELIGAIGLTIHRHNHRAELGYWIGVAYWNCGYMSEAARRVIAYAFDDLNLNRVYASHFTRNPASGRVMQKAGMTYEGTLREHFVRWTSPEDLVYYGILKKEWDARQSTSSTT